jgi:tetratricopeptide (TPR) repeat protein
VSLVGGAYWVKVRTAPEAAGQEALMKAGLDDLYTRNDPLAAAVKFRGVLALNPAHYGATLQLAKALDRAGKPAEARPLWEKMKEMAQSARDEETLKMVSDRLARPEPMSEEAIQKSLMEAGLARLYQKNDPAAAALEFRKVLARNPAHYGATFQLAVALDRVGKPAEARPLWEKALKSAESFNDQPTMTAARERLARNP